MTTPVSRSSGALTSVSLTVNGSPVTITAAPMSRLSQVLREDLGLTGTKVGCDAGDCGACTVLLDDAAVCACLTPIGRLSGQSVRTIESLTPANCSVSQDGVSPEATPAREVSVARDVSAGQEAVGAALQKSFLDNGGTQCGFCTPGMLMASQALLEGNAAPSTQEICDGLGGVLCRCTGYRQIIDSVADASRVLRGGDPLAPEDAPVGKAVGVSINRVDGVQKVTGTELFGDDGAPESAHTVAIIRSPHHHASFSLGDLDQYAIETSGVVTVLSARDIPGVNCFGVIPPMADQPVFAIDTTRFLGEAIAAVIFEPGVATTTTGFPVQWVELEPMLDPIVALADGAPLLHSERTNNVLTKGLVTHGDVASAMDAADATSKATFTTSFVEHAYIEPEAGWAQVDDNGHLSIHATTQAPYMDLIDTAAVLNLDQSALSIRPTACGGGFGGKLDVSIQPIIGLAALTLAKLSQRSCNAPSHDSGSDAGIDAGPQSGSDSDPDSRTGSRIRSSSGRGRPETAVKVLYSRTESMASTTKRHPAIIEAKLGANNDGTFAALSFSGTFNTGAYASWGPTVANRVPIHASGPYTYGAYDAHSTAVHTHCAPAGAFRGFGVPQSAIAQEALVDELADALGLDPLEMRITNALRAGDSTVTGQVFDSGVGFIDCLESLRHPYNTSRQRVAAFNEAAKASGDSRRAGVGVAGAWYGCGNTALPNPSTIKVGLTRDGLIRLHQGAVDIGQGSNTVMSQICADGLGIDVRQISLVEPDTDITPDAGKTSASRQTYVSGNATSLAARDLRSKLLTLAEVHEAAMQQTAMRETDTSETDTSETDMQGAERPTGGGGPGTVFEPDHANMYLDGSSLVAQLGDQHINIDLSELPLDEHGYVATAFGTYDPPTKALDERGQGEPYAVFGFGAQVIELDVDLETGAVAIHSVDAAYDVGKAINPALVEGQIVGGVAQGIGLALMEEFVPGRTNNLHDYLIPTIGDIPEVSITLVESGDPLGPHGAKGVGEHSLIPTPPAVLNAIRNATGVAVRHVPATPVRILDALTKAKIANA